MAATVGVAQPGILMIGILPFRGGQEGRLEAARHVVLALKPLCRRMVVVEQDATHTEMGADAVVSLPDPGPFNRSACFDAGVRAQRDLAPREPILFTDCDVLCSPESLRASLAALDRHDAVSPYKTLIELSREASQAVYLGTAPGEGVPRTGLNLTGGAVLMTHWAFRECGGWDEEMEGWGGEDDLMSNKIVKLGIRHLFLSFTAHHLWHDRGAWGPDADAQYRRNLARLDHVFHMPSDVLRREMSLNQSSAGRWDALHQGVREPWPYGDPTTYLRGAAFLQGLAVEDWGCGPGWFRGCVDGPFRGVDGSRTPAVDAVVDLCEYTSCTPGLFMRHVLEHNQDWQRILRNAVSSFTGRMVLVIFTPFAPHTRVLCNREYRPGLFIPEISFARRDLLREIEPFLVGEESLRTETQYGIEHVFYLERTSSIGGNGAGVLRPCSLTGTLLAGGAG
ncbi:MAG TPA: galactosyltransferase-related protein [Vicinamibacteria bacterium]|nr:galactosyltransferase-related protein [Vicinamibacteria bacterium]